MQQSQDPAIPDFEALLQASNQIGPFVLRALVLVVGALLLSKLLGVLLTRLLLRMNVPERRAVLPVTVVRLGILVIAALYGLHLVGFPALSVFRLIFAIALVLIAVLVIFRPFLPKLPLKEGDHVSQAGFSGHVERMTFTHTIIRTLDGNTVFVPNHKLLNDPLLNYTEFPKRRADVPFFIAYDEDADTAREVVRAVLNEHEMVLEEPGPAVAVSRLEPSFREMTARFWLSPKGYVGAKWAVTGAIDRALADQGIRRGTPRMEVASESTDRLAD